MTLSTGGAACVHGPRSKKTEKALVSYFHNCGKTVEKHTHKSL